MSERTRGELAAMAALDAHKARLMELRDSPSYQAGKRWANQATKAELWYKHYLFNAIGSFPCPDLESLVECLGPEVLEYADDQTDTYAFVDAVCEVADANGWTDPRCHYSHHVDAMLHEEFLTHELPEARTVSPLPCDHPVYAFTPHERDFVSLNDVLQTIDRPE